MLVYLIPLETKRRQILLLLHLSQLLILLQLRLLKMLSAILIPVIMFHSKRASGLKRKSMLLSLIIYSQIFLLLKPLLIRHIKQVRKLPIP